jgi:hypothetical protein
MWPTERMHIWAKVPEGRIEARTFEKDDAGYEAATAWVLERDGKSNIYFVVNDIDVRLGIDTREDPNDGDKIKPILMPRETDVVRMVATQVDSDPRANLDAKTPAEFAAHFEAEKQRLLDVYATAEPRLNVIVFTGGGCQGFHLLKDPIVVDHDPTRIRDAKLLNVALKRSPGFNGSDDCESLQHVMRLPGTINLPDARKVKRGRKATSSYLVRFDDLEAWHATAALPKAPPDPEEARNASGFSDTGKYATIKSDDPQLIKVDPKWIELGLRGDTESKYLGSDGKTDRSKMALAFATALIRAGVDDQIIASIFMDPTWLVGACIRDKGGETKRQLKRTIERAHKFVDEDFEKPALLGKETWLKTSAVFLARVWSDLVHFNDEFYVYRIAYIPMEEATVRAECRKFLGESRVVVAMDKTTGVFETAPFNPCRADVSELVDALADVCHIDREAALPPSWKNEVS